tara:strand:+ start:9675 stop:13148 length:3474 start_codon:yes stop_codon:yes gene_type:complete
MPLKFEANLINQLGKQLPTPVIEKVEIYNDRLSITVSIYVETSEGLSALNASTPATSSVNEYLKGLKLYCFYVLGENDALGLIKKRNYKIFNEITTAQQQLCLRPSSTSAFLSANIDLHNESDIASITGGNNSQALGQLINEYNNNSGTTSDVDAFFLRINYPNYFLIDIEEMVQSSEQLYSEEGHPIIQYTTTQDINIGFVDSELNLGHGSESIFSAISSALDEMTIFAFSSPLVLESDIASNHSTGWTPTLGNPWQVKWDLDYTHSYAFTKYKTSLNPVLNRTLYVNEFSDVAYEKVFKSPGLINNEGQDVYVTTSGDVFNGTPIRSTKGGYYADAAIRLQTIEEDFRDFNNSYKAAASNNPKLQAAVDSVSYVLENNKEDSNLLYELNQYRKAFPQKVGSGVLANYYKRFRGLIAASDKRARQGGVLSPKQIRNTKLIDYRGIGPSGYTLPEIPLYNRVSDFLYWKNALVSHTLYRDDVENIFKGQIHGYFFFDLQKAFHTQSVIAQVFDYGKLLNIFGVDLMRRYYYISTVDNDWYLDMNKEVDEPVAWEDVDTAAFFMFGNIRTYLGIPQDGVRYDFPGNLATEFQPLRQGEGGLEYSPVFVKHELEIGEMEYTYLLPRSFDIPSSSPLLDRYNLVCFEFQNLYTSQDANPTPAQLETLLDYRYVFKAEVKCTDNTRELYEALVNSYKTLFEGDFTEYYTHAIESCNFNSLTQKFNTFFSEAMTALYSAHPIKPWAEMALAYYLHQDLIHNSFNGDDTAIREAATLVSEQINPETGLLPALQLFYANALELYETFYHPDSELAQKINNLSTDVIHRFGPGIIGPVPFPDVAEIEVGGTFATITDIHIPQLVSVSAGIQDMWAQDLTSASSSDWMVNNLSYYQGWTDVTAERGYPGEISTTEWRRLVRSAMTDLQNVRMKYQAFQPKGGGASSQHGVRKYDPLYKDIRSHIKTLVQQTFVHFNLKEATGEINSLNINDYLTTAEINHILHQTNPRIVTTTQPGLKDIMTSDNYNTLQIYNPLATSDGALNSLVGIESETAALLDTLYPTSNKSTYSFHSNGGDGAASDTGTGPFVENAYRRLIVLAYGWFYYEANKFAPEWTNNPMDFVFDNGRWEIPIWANGDSPLSLPYPSYEWVHAMVSSDGGAGQWPFA